MKQFLFFILLLGISTKTFGQLESNLKFKAIPPMNIPPKKEVPPPIENPKTETPKLEIPVIESPNVFSETNIYGTKPKIDNSFEIGESKKDFSMIIQDKFQHKPGDIYRDKMTKDLSKTMIREGLKEDTGNLDRTDRYLGDYKTKSNSLVVNYRDYIQIDGDLISVYLNDNLIQSQLFLNFNFGQFTIALSEGINKIEFVVASQGTSGGNTAELHVYDDNSNQLTQEFWNNLALGTRIKLIVIKE